MALTFDADIHAYHLNGVRLPSVTQVLFEAGLVDTAWYTDEARLRGTYVHAALALDHEGELDDDTLDPALAPYVTAWREYKRDAAIQVLSYEQPVCDPERGYAGTYDVIVTDATVMPPLLIDVKSGEPEPWAELQTAAYARAVKATDLPVLRRAALWLRDDGTYRLIRHTDRNDERLFLACLEIVQWKRANL